MNEEIKRGDRVRVVKIKFPELHPKYPERRITPSNQDFMFQASKIVGHEGVVVSIRSEAETDYEKRTGEIEKYYVEIDNIPDKIESERKKKWMGKKHYWPEELIKI